MLNLNRKSNKEAGFSLAEVMFVLVIAAILFGIVIVAFQTLSRNSRNQARQNDRTFIQTTIARYYGQNNAWPDATQLGSLLGGSEQELNLVGVSATGTLNVADTGGTTQKTIYIRHIPAPGTPAPTAASPEQTITQFTVAAADPRLDPNSVIIVTGAVCLEDSTAYIGGTNQIDIDAFNNERNTVAMFYVEEGSDLLVCNDNKL